MTTNADLPTEDGRDNGQALIKRFQDSFGEPHLLLACHCALPLVLTPELVHYLRTRFLRGLTPYFAEADLLLSPLCRPVGYELFALEPDARVQLLKLLVSRTDLGPTRKEEVAQVLLRYAEHLEQQADWSRAEVRDQKWAAMLYLDDQRQTAVAEMAQALRKAAVKQDLAAQRHLADLITRQSELLTHYPELIGEAEYIRQKLDGTVTAKSESPFPRHPTSDRAIFAAKVRQIDSITIDIHRLGSPGGLIRKGERYIVLAGQHAPASQVEMRLEHEDFLRSLNSLRYRPGVTLEQTREALDTLAKHAGDLLPSLGVTHAERPLQIDLVMGAAELWAFPFEAHRANGIWTFADRSRPMILTRRIRQGFTAEKRPWPVRPRILFVHAAAATDLPEPLIQQHLEVLQHALKPWSPKNDPQGDGLLKMELILDTGDLQQLLRAAREDDPKGPFTHVHILAHGKKVKDPWSGAVRWGLRLGSEKQEPIEPQELADALKPEGGRPAVVTLAACDSGNQAEPTIPKRSFAQELHKKGIPIVIASQFPLTFPGSVTLTRGFYQTALQGGDVRWALHKARLALREETEKAGVDHYDWVSLVGYVQLPEGYEAHLMEVGVQLEMELLKAARSKLDRALDGPGDVDLEPIESLVRVRIGSLEQRLEIIPKELKELRAQCQGVLASAHKRLAELLFRIAGRTPGPLDRAKAQEASRNSLHAALKNYRAGYRAYIQYHWLGGQQLSLEAVLDGAFRDPRNWHTTFHAAELALANSKDEFWAYGTLAELWLLAPFVGNDKALDKAKAALDSLVERAQDPFAAESTRDQFSRYTNWWLKPQGFFGDGDDLAADAQELLAHLANAVARKQAEIKAAESGGADELE